jgi:uncharacterized protein (TIGR04551 family)
VSTKRTTLCAALTAAIATFAAARDAHATGFAELGEDIVQRDKVTVELDGYLRTRGEALHNFDLDRGLSPSGTPLFPVSKADPTAQTLTHWDMRARLDVKVFAPGQTFAVKLRLDALDNLSLGSVPNDVPAATTGQRSPADPLKIRRAYGEALLPFGLLVAGRMGTHWGLGLVANGGDCLDCDSADAQDRVALVTPIANHVFAVAYDFSATGPVGTRPAQNRFLDLERTTNVQTATMAFLRGWSKESIARRKKAGKVTVDYGGYFTHRWQTNDVPGSYLPTAQAIDVSSANQIMARGLTATAFDAWAKVVTKNMRLEAEAAMLLSTIEEASAIPGVSLRDPVKARQFGAAFESDFGSDDGLLSAGLDLGYASGDPAPGMGVSQKLGQRAPKAGDLDGPQANPRRDNRIDNFRFHPDYRIDRILFREIVGTVTDAVYARPHARVRLVEETSFRVTATGAAVASMASFAESTPGGKKPLGVEIDPSITYEHKDGFFATLDYAVLFPLAGLDNPQVGLFAKPAQLVRLRFNYVF